MPNPGLTKNFTAGAAIAAHRICKLSADYTAIQAAAAADASIGVSELAADSGARADIILSGTADIEFGGSVTRGLPVTSDVDGKAVLAAPATGANARVIGFAMVTAAAGDILPVLLCPSIMQGP